MFPDTLTFLFCRNGSKSYAFEFLEVVLNLYISLCVQKHFLFIYGLFFFVIYIFQNVTRLAV